MVVVVVVVVEGGGGGFGSGGVRARDGGPIWVGGSCSSSSYGNDQAGVDCPTNRDVNEKSI